MLTVRLESCFIKTVTIAFPLIGTGFPPFYRVIDPIARDKYATTIMLMGHFQSAFTANLLSIKEVLNRNCQKIFFGNINDSFSYQVLLM